MNNGEFFRPLSRRLSAGLLGLVIAANQAYAQGSISNSTRAGAPSHPESIETSAIKNNSTENKSDDQNGKKKDGWLDSILKAIGADGKFDPDKGINWSFLPGPFFSPDADFGVGLSTIGLYQLDPTDKVSQLSSLTINGFVSTNKSLGVVISNRMFLAEDQYRFYVDAAFIDAPEVYYGVGYEQNIRSSNLQDYTERRYAFTPRLLTRVFKDSYIGVGIDYDFVNARDVHPTGAPPVSSADFPNKSTSSGVLVQFVHDSRDFILNPYKGRLVKFSINYYNQAFGSDNNFSTYLFDYRDYWQVQKGPGILAFQFKADLTNGKVPWNQLPKIGGGQGLRGYVIGRYRDHQALISQLEYRLHLTGRHGIVTWVGGAALADKVSDFSFKQLLPNGGVGYRLKLKERVNLRLDLGFGRDGSGVYFNVNEAF